MYLDDRRYSGINVMIVVLMFIVSALNVPYMVTIDQNNDINQDDFIQFGFWDNIKSVVGKVVDTVKSVVSPPKQTRTISSPAPSPSYPSSSSSTSSTTSSVRSPSYSYNVISGSGASSSYSSSSSSGSSSYSSGSSGTSYYYQSPSCVNTCKIDSVCGFWDKTLSATVPCTTSDCRRSSIKCSFGITCSLQGQKLLIDEYTEEAFCGNCISFRDCKLEAGHPVMRCNRDTREGECVYEVAVEGYARTLGLVFLGSRY